MAILTLKNRYPAEPFIGRFDGQPYVVTDTLAVPDHVAFHLKKQSIVKDNPVTGEATYRLCILERDGDMEPLEELPAESLDRQDMDFPKAILVKGVKTPAPQRAERFGSLEVGSKGKA